MEFVSGQKMCIYVCRCVCVCVFFFLCVCLHVFICIYIMYILMYMYTHTSPYTHRRRTLADGGRGDARSDFTNNKILFLLIMNFFSHTSSR